MFLGCAEVEGSIALDCLGCRVQADHQAKPGGNSWTVLDKIGY